MIRPYTPADKEALLALLRLNIPTYFHPSEEQEFSDYLEQHLDHYYVVEEGGRLVGAGGVNFADDRRTVRISWDFFTLRRRAGGWAASCWPIDWPCSGSIRR
ncbi:GNAT family N-acetyltransferase [Cesiribacter andamanensis]|uniref:N-acetyltransferase domain-containing protein n=1 Tax=Cesiribacter andamanensis AMV16 TaxID=1279009 RepID=M7MYH9_9BACT|nr:hypothetical protein [Cesiribacter andamanensis]EMR01508.1 hypothetical protein ADICEAN_03365 [Cesiribacter andamanensis AMV16]